MNRYYPINNNDLLCMVELIIDQIVKAYSTEAAGVVLQVADPPGEDSHHPDLYFLIFLRSFDEEITRKKEQLKERIDQLCASYPSGIFLIETNEKDFEERMPFIPIYRMIYEGGIQVYSAGSENYRFENKHYNTLADRIRHLLDEGSCRRIVVEENGREDREDEEFILACTGTINGNPAAVAVLDSMSLTSCDGWACAEKLTRLIETAVAENLPLVLISDSVGMRASEGIPSLAQIAKITCALQRHSEAGGLYVSILADSRIDSQYISYGLMGDIILAEPPRMKAYIRPQLLSLLTRQDFSLDYQNTEYLLEHGFIDRIVEPPVMKETLSAILKLHRPHR